MINYSEQELIKACQEDQSWAQKVIFDKYYRPIYLVAYRYCKCDEDIQEVLNDTFFDFFCNVRKFRGDSKLDTYLTQIAIFKAIKKYKESVKKSQMFQSSDIQLFNFEEGESLNSLEDLEFSDTVLQALKQLPEKERLVFNLFVMEDYSHKEIAELLQIKESTSRYFLFNAKHILKDILSTSSKKSFSFNYVYLITLFFNLIKF